MPAFRSSLLALATGLLAGVGHAQEPATTTTTTTTTTAPSPGAVLDAIDADSREHPAPVPAAPAEPLPPTPAATPETAPPAFVPGQEISVEATPLPATPATTVTTTTTTPAPAAAAAAAAEPGPAAPPVTTTVTTSTVVPGDAPTPAPLASTTIDPDAPAAPTAEPPAPVLAAPAPAPVLPDASVPVILSPVTTPTPAVVTSGPLSYEPGYVAASTSPPPYLGVTYSHMFPTDSTGVRSGPGFGVFAGIPLTPWIALEGGISGFRLPAKSGNENADLKPLFGQLGLAYSLFTRQNVDFLLLGSGGYGRAMTGSDRSLSYGDVGLGFNGKTGYTNLSLRADVRFARLFGVAEQNTIRANAGVLLALGAPPPVDTTTRDDDGDGVVNGRDRCPGTLAGTLVDGFGCPVPPVVDADGDGIPDAWDLCPGTPASTITDKRGCEASRASAEAAPTNPVPLPAPPPPPLVVTPLPAGPTAGASATASPGETRVETVAVRPPTATDADGDGVENLADACPDTLPGLLVDARGCAIRQTLVLPAVTFEANGAKLTQNAAITLDTVAHQLAGQPGMRLDVGGFTDSLGPEAANLALSTKRAQAVREALLARGVAAGRISAEGFGEFVPIADNATEAGRAQNRRIEFTFVPTATP